ncbi:MAG: dTDP-Rha--alpha-D-GlcNAc-pyrophosphate polyprenol alpha-3-L-rhamnosyltransferase [Flavobacteriales bacterium]|nr:MAG: dTDP-Rha--alpha-D-GlcNAc-pyrophosphate polyprenol alpha-3-L-rhamnosyltransferase [Flavobacteriales bacterium]
MKIAIAILNWNGKKWLEKFLPSVILHSQNAEIHIIDNASTDDSVAFVKAHFPSVKIIINKKNKGFAGGYNEGLKSIDADIFCLLNSDVEVTENWLTPIIDLFKKDSDIAVVQPKVLDYSRKEYFEFAGAGGGMIDNLGYPYCRGRIFEKVEKDHGQYNDETEIFWASGCAFFIRSKDFWSENGFDERFFAHQEEIDLCWRLKNKNKKVFYCGQSEIYHIGGATLQKQSPRKTYLNFRNNLSMLLKNLPSPLLFPLIFFRLCLDGIAGVRFLLQGKWKHTLAIIKAHFGFYAQAKTTFKMRSQHQMKNYFQTKWIIFRHFL